MKSFLIILATILLFLNRGYCQQPAWAWAIGNNVSTADEKCITSDSSGNIYTAGRYLAKYSPNGNLLWATDLQKGPGAVWAKGIARDLAGNIYLTGYFSGSISLDAIALASFGHTDIFIAKFNTNGTVLWARHAGTAGPPPVPRPPIVTDAAWGIAVDAGGNSYITGQYGNSPTQQAVFDNISLAPASAGYAFFVAKYDSYGQVQWVRNVPGNPYNIALGKSGSYYLAGTGQMGIYLSKYSHNGRLVWQDRAKSSITAGNVFGLCTDSSGNAYLTGTMNSPITFGTAILTGNLFLVKYDTAGVVQWANTNQNLGVGNCSASHLALDNNGHVFITGAFDSIASFGGMSMLQSKRTGGDIFVARFSAATGNSEWAIHAEGATADYGTGIASLPNGDCVISGIYGRDCQFGNTFLQGLKTGSSYFLARTSAHPLGLAKSKSEGKLTVFPNPATTIVTISKRIGDKGLVAVFNSKGQKVYQVNLKPEVKFSVASWPAGVYMIKLVSNSGTTMKKLIVLP